MPEEPMMTEAQRDELKTLCLKAEVPGKSGELLTQEGAQQFIDELKKQRAAPNRNDALHLGGAVDGVADAAWIYTP